jgi:hypothetical protein
MRLSVVRVALDHPIEDRHGAGNVTVVQFRQPQFKLHVSLRSPR